MAVDNPCRCPRPFQVDDGCVKCGRTVDYSPPSAVIDTRPRCPICTAVIESKQLGRPKLTCGTNRCAVAYRAKRRKERAREADSIRP